MAECVLGVEDMVDKDYGPLKRARTCSFVIQHLKRR